MIGLLTVAFFVATPQLTQITALSSIDLPQFVQYMVIGLGFTGRFTKRNYLVCVALNHNISKFFPKMRCSLQRGRLRRRL
jgi:hypothetical protein